MDTNRDPFRMVTVAITEMQTRLSEMLTASPPVVTQVTYQATPVVALIPQALFQEISTELLKEREPHWVSLSSTQARKTFLSYTRRLKPLVEMEGEPLPMIEVTRGQRRTRVGVIVAWCHWQRYQEEQGIALPPVELHQQRQRTVTISAIRHSLFRLGEQFERETALNILRPVVVENHEEIVFAIVPPRWYKLVTDFLQSHYSEYLESQGLSSSGEADPVPNDSSQTRE